MVFSQGFSAQNYLLASLPDEVYQRLAPDLQLVSLGPRQILYDTDAPIEAFYFPTHSLISLLCLMENGAMVEAGVIGKEGMFGISVLLGQPILHHRQALVQVPGQALRIEVAPLKAEFDRAGALQTRLLRYIYAQLMQISQVAACNQLHSLEQRFARWLLAVSDSLASDQLPLTQEFIALMLGNRRAGVTTVAQQFQQKGMIRYSRGQITIVDRAALEIKTCECRRIMREEIDRMLFSAN